MQEDFCSTISLFLQILLAYINNHVMLILTNITCTKSSFIIYFALSISVLLVIPTRVLFLSVDFYNEILEINKKNVSK